MKRDTNNVAFMNYESLPKFQGSSEIDSSLYDKVFEGEVNCFTLEKLYEIFNLEHPAGYKGRSMSVSDVVEIIDGNTGKSYFHFCDSFGFQQISFKPEKTQVSDRFLSLADQEKISVLLVPVGKSPVVKEIPNTYEAMKELVGGGGLDEYMPHCLLYVPFNFIVFALYRNYEFIPQTRPSLPFSSWEGRAGAPPLWLHQLQYQMT